MDNPYLGCGLNELAHACDERAGELHARAWHSEAERDALREATADLLSAVSRQLSDAWPPAPGNESVPPPDTLGMPALREIIANHVSHVPLSVGARHAWVQAFVPGEGDTPPPRG